MPPSHALQALDSPPGHVPGSPERRSWAGRLVAAASTSLGTVAGLAPHLLHHLAPIAGAALFTGAAGSILFGVLGFVLLGPMLVRLRRRFDSWLAPTAALGLFLVMFTVSTVWIGPAIRGGGDATLVTEPVDPHGH